MTATTRNSGSVRTWLYRIATNACLNALESRSRRPLPSGVGQPFDDPDAAFVPGFEVPWLQPIPDRLLGTAPDDPAVLATERSGLRLAVVAALQLLPAKQRAALILRDVLEFSAAEVASMLDMSTAAVNSALQRARAAFAGPGLAADSLKEPELEHREVVDRYMTAFERADVEGLARMLARGGGLGDASHVELVHRAGRLQPVHGAGVCACGVVIGGRFRSPPTGSRPWWPMPARAISTSSTPCRCSLWRRGHSADHRVPGPRGVQRSSIFRKFFRDRDDLGSAGRYVSATRSPGLGHRA